MHCQYASLTALQTCRQIEYSQGVVGVNKGFCTAALHMRMSICVVAFNLYAAEMAFNASRAWE